jgi:hypothetical protein
MEPFRIPRLIVNYSLEAWNGPESPYPAAADDDDYVLI